MELYSPVSSRTFHLNIELCNSAESIKYKCKYANKGRDQATVVFKNDNADEVLSLADILALLNQYGALSFPI